MKKSRRREGYVAIEDEEKLCIYKR